MTWLRLLAVVVLAVFMAPARADVVTYKDGDATPFVGGMYTGAQETTLITPFVDDNNFGGEQFLSAGLGANLHHALVRFDITSLSGNFSSINSVTLRLYTQGVFLQTPGGSETVHMFRAADANTGWVEGTARGIAPPQVGSSSWSARNWHPVTPTPWAGLPGASLAGTDYTTSLAVAAFDGTTPLDTPFDLLFGDVSFIADWAAGNNSGLFLRTSELTFEANLINFWTSEEPGAFRPELIIDFNPMPVPEPGSVLLTAAVASLLGLRAYCRRASRMTLPSGPPTAGAGLAGQPSRISG